MEHIGNRQYRVDHSELGPVTVTCKSAARNISARWKEGSVRITAPFGISSKEVLEALDIMAPRLLRRRSVISFASGDIIGLDGLSIGICVQDISPRRVLCKCSVPESFVCVGSQLDLSSLTTTVLISRAMAAVARRLAFRMLIPRARELADRVGCHPSAWKISSGKKVLGKCDTKGVISLSHMNVFLPQDLRDYVVFHELAHLSEMNHSTRFHVVCDRYCMGREKVLARRLRNYVWPLLR